MCRSLRAACAAGPSRAASVYQPIRARAMSMAATTAGRRRVSSRPGAMTASKLGRIMQSEYTAKRHRGVALKTSAARSMFVQTETTPNEDSLKFIPGSNLSETGQTHEFLSSQDARTSPLASALFDISGVRLVFFGPDFLTVSKSEDSQWGLLKPEIYSVIIEHFSQGKALFYEGQKEGKGPQDTRILETDSEIVAMVKELLDTRVRPAIQEDGGDLEYQGFDEATGHVRVSLKGSCRGCDSSAVTLKNGIERMLMHYVRCLKTAFEYAAD